MKAKRLPLACLPLLCCPLAGCAPEEADDGMATITFVLTVHVTLEGEFEPYDYLAGDLFRTEMSFPKGTIPTTEDEREIGEKLASRTPYGLYPENVCPWYTAGAPSLRAMSYSRYLDEPFAGTPIEEDRECYYAVGWYCWLAGPPDGWEGNWPPTSPYS